VQADRQIITIDIVGLVGSAASDVSELGRQHGTLVVGFCGQPHYCYRPYYPTARFRSPSSYMVSDEPFPDRSRPMSC